KGITLDLKRPEGRSIARRLALEADVLIENFRPGAAERFGLGYDDLARENPRLVYCSLPAFGSRGPLRDRPGYEALVAARAAVYANQGMSLPPIYTLIPFGSYLGAFLAAYSTVIALWVREAVTNRGQRVEVPLFNAALAGDSGALVRFEGSMRRGWHQQGVAPMYRLYEAGDGKWLFIACGNPKFRYSLSVALDHPEWVSDPRFQTGAFNMPAEGAQELIDQLQAIFHTRPRDEWLEYLRASDIPCAPVLTREEYRDHPQVKANQAIIEVEDALVGVVRQIGVTPWLKATPGEVRAPAPLLGEHTAEVLSGLGYSTEEIRSLGKSGVLWGPAVGAAAPAPTRV
ncbi:MAG TPA: CoA transferase, partial [Dehalococcoidia bacterium]|nr:CoA transferase [Dehalococcoidia bacterium]